MMLLRSRPAHIDEIPSLFERFGKSFAYREEILPHVPGIWQQLLLEERMVVTLFEDLDQAGAPAIGFEARVFVAPAFFNAFLVGDRPHFGNRIIEAILAGHDPVLNRAQMRQAHRGDGLYCFIINNPIGQAKYTDDEIAQIDTAWSVELDQLACINLKEVALEVYGDFMRKLSGHCGTIMRNDFPEYWEEHGAEIGNDQRPFVMGMSREEAHANRGAHAARIFARRWPRLPLTRPQQELLQFAVTGQTDQELADSLYLSLSAVKKRWTAIYGLVDQALPGLLPAASLSEDSARGTEKRRYLLNYIREHREELEPLNAIERGLTEQEAVAR